MQMSPEFEISRDVLIDRVKTAVAPFILEDKVIDDIEKKLPFSKIERYVRQGVVKKEQVLEIVEKFALSLSDIKSKEVTDRFHPYPMGRITSENVQMAFDNLAGACPFCI
jgi:hypothetical protein